jgi:AdoMet-dependent rRNA methyltransferase SPB1
MNKAGLLDDAVDQEVPMSSESDSDSNSENGNENDEENLDILDEQMDFMYEQYRERKAEKDAKYRAKRSREEVDDEEFSGLDDKGDDESNSDSESDLEEIETIKEVPQSNGLSAAATDFFSRAEFTEFDLDESDEDLPTPNHTKEDSSFVQEYAAENGEQQATSNHNNLPVDIDIVTEEAMQLAQQVASKQTSIGRLTDDTFNKYSFRDRDGLPTWFLDDESHHSKIQKPISAAAATAIKEKLRALNARPIKKVQEAKARKKFKQIKQAAKIQKKAETINEGDSTEKEKAEGIQKLMKRVKKPQLKRPPVKVVVARGANRGRQGRPKGVKGKYKMVDPRMKKEMRAAKKKDKK